MNWKIILFDAFLVATGFAVMESLFRWYNGNGSTTIEQFIMNIFYSPVSIHGYRYLIKSPITRIILFPFNVWVAEIFMGSYLLYMHEIRVWHYNDDYAYFNGFITFAFAHYWILLGVVVVLVFDIILCR
jgi:hypothetical protein